MKEPNQAVGGAEDSGSAVADAGAGSGLNTGLEDAHIGNDGFSANANAPQFHFIKSRAAIGSFTTVVTGDQLGEIVALGDDGTDYDTLSSAIVFDTEGTVSTVQVPGIIRLRVAKAGTLADAVTIDSNRRVAFGGPKAGAFINIQPGIEQLDLVTAVGIGLNIEADTWDINILGNTETKPIAALTFFGIPTWTSTGTGLTLTDAATVYIQGPPVDSTNVTATTKYGLWVDAGDVRLDDDLDLKGRFRQSTVTTLGSTATPSVSAGNVFKTVAAGTNITDFDDGVVGQTIWVEAADSIDIAHEGSTIRLVGAATYSMTATDILVLTMFTDGIWTEISRSVI